MIPRSRRLGIALVTASALAWSTTGLFTRLIPLDAATLLVWRGLFGALGLIAVLAAFEGSKGLKSFARLGVAGWAYVAISALGMLCFIAALRLTSVAHVAIIYAVVPFLAAALTWQGYRVWKPMGKIREHIMTKRRASSCSMPEFHVKRLQRDHPDPNAIPLPDLGRPARTPQP